MLLDHYEHKPGLDKLEAALGPAVTEAFGFPPPERAFMVAYHVLTQCEGEEPPHARVPVPANELDTASVVALETLLAHAVNTAVKTEDWINYPLQVFAGQLLRGYACYEDGMFYALQNRRWADRQLSDGERDRGMGPLSVETALQAFFQCNLELEKEQEQEFEADDDGIAILPASPCWTENAHEIEPLLAFTTLIDVRWLLKFAKGEVMPECNGIVPAWQQLPEEAEARLEQLKWFCLSFLPIAVLSYGWASKTHPDPSGEQLAKLVPVLEAMVDLCSAQSTWGIVWDYMSLPQRGRTTGYDPEVDDRTPDQLARFSSGLKNINAWYGHLATITLVLSTAMPNGAENTHSCDRRGWCIFERNLSALVKTSRNYLELDRLEGNIGKGERLKWEVVVHHCKANRRAPMAPDAFEEMMHEGVGKEEAHPGTGIKFTSGKDLKGVVIPQYRQCVLRLFSKCTYLDYVGLRWRDEQATQLAGLLAYLQSNVSGWGLEEINIRANLIGDVGAAAIADALKHCEKACRVDMCHNMITVDGAHWLLESHPKLQLSFGRF